MKLKKQFSFSYTIKFKLTFFEIELGLSHLQMFIVHWLLYSLFLYIHYFF